MRNLLPDGLPSDVQRRIAGASAIINEFGGWPRFHDAEVLKLSLERNGPTLGTTLYAFVTSAETDSAGRFKREHECFLTFAFDNVVNLEISDFNHQNVLADLVFKAAEDGLQVTFEAIFGLAASFRCTGVRLTGMEHHVLMPPRPPTAGSI